MAGEREANPNWRGGRIKTEHGYIMIRVGKKHHLSDCRGYAYEHRLEAERKIGRRLLPNEDVKHLGAYDDNRHHMIEVIDTKKRRSLTRKKRTDLRELDGPNPIVSCACGCGETFLKFDPTNRPRRFVPGHNLRR